MNIVFILSEYSLHNHILSSYLNSRRQDRVAVIKVPLVIKGQSRTETVTRIFPQLSRRFIIGKLLEAIVVLAVTFVPKILRKGAVFIRLQRICKQSKINFFNTRNIMSEQSLNFLRQQEPDLIITLVHQIIKQPLIEMPRVGILNIHPGLLPEFRGIQPYFWALSEGFAESGVSIHWIENESVDSGPLVAKASYRVKSGMSVHLNYYLTALCAAQVLPRCVDVLSNDHIPGVVQVANAGRYWRWPDSRGYDNLGKRGHDLFSWSDLWDILRGGYDDFKPMKVELSKGISVINKVEKRAVAKQNVSTKKPPGQEA